MCKSGYYTPGEYSCVQDQQQTQQNSFWLFFWTNIRNITKKGMNSCRRDSRKEIKVWELRLWRYLYFQESWRGASKTWKLIYPFHLFTHAIYHFSDRSNMVVWSTTNHIPNHETPWDIRGGRGKEIVKRLLLIGDAGRGERWRCRCRCYWRKKKNCDHNRS